MNPSDYDPTGALENTFDLGNFKLEGGETLEQAKLTYIEHGRPNADRSNAILVVPWIGGQARGYDFMVGADKAFDPERWWIICVDAFGNGRASSPGNSPTQPGPLFPRFTIRDIVRAQHRLVREHLGIERLAAVAGISMGGMQTLEWGVSHPGMMQRLIAMVPLYRSPTYTRGVNELCRRALMSDPEWNGGDPKGPLVVGWRLFAGIQQVHICLTPRGFDALAESETGGDAASLIDLNERIIIDRGVDPWNWIYQSWAYDGHDVTTARDHGGDAARALGSIRARTLILHAPDDHYNPVWQAREAGALIPGAECIEVPSSMGHWCVSPKDPGGARFTAQVIREFLDREPDAERALS